jgi:hypothetical protein
MAAPLELTRFVYPVLNGMPRPRLLDRVRAAIRARHYSRRTEEAYVAWIRRYIFFHGKRHPAEMGAPEISRFLTSLAVDRKVAASTQNQALSALLFLYRAVLEVLPAAVRDDLAAHLVLMREQHSRDRIPTLLVNGRGSGPFPRRGCTWTGRPANDGAITCTNPSCSAPSRMPSDTLGSRTGPVRIRSATPSPPRGLVGSRREPRGRRSAGVSQRSGFVDTCGSAGMGRPGLRGAGYSAGLSNSSSPNLELANRGVVE